MEKLSFENAQEEALGMENLVADKSARDYKEADLIVSLDKKSAELKDAEEMIEWLNQKHEDLISEWRKALIESTTGLKRREALYKDMEEFISDLFGVEDISKISDKELLALFKTKNPVDFRGEPLHVMLGDMSYLSLANKGGHRQGDKFLGETGKTIKNEFASASRHGGDEFTTLILLGKDEAEKKVAKLETDIKNMKNIPELERYGLSPNIDIGIAHFSEGLKAFQEIISLMEKNNVGKAGLAKLNILREMEDIWLEIADKRSMVKKAQERIPILLEKRKNNPKEYKKLYKSLNKGAYDIDEKDLDVMDAKIKKGEDSNKLIFGFIKKMELKDLAKKTGYEKAKATAIIRTANKQIL